MAATAKTKIGGSGFVASIWKAVAAPTVDNDATKGHKVGDLWLDTTAVKAYLCFATGTGAATWKEITLVS